MNARDQNRVALLTAPGVAAIAVLRLSGPALGDFLARRFSKPVLPDRCVHGELRDDRQVIDDCLVVRSGDTAELNLHGGAWVVRCALALAENDGFFKVDAEADGDTPLWRTVLKSLPSAPTEQAVRMVLAQPSAWESPGDLPTILADCSGQWMLATPRVAIVGPANVGKSTLANQLFGQARSITADLPGTTRDWVGEIANIDGLAVMLVDTPGMRATNDRIEDAAINAGQQQISAADLVILVLDQSLPLDRTMVDAFPDSIRVANKSDVSPAWSSTEIGAIQTVATAGDGLEQLRTEIRRRFGCEPMDLSSARWWTSEQRHHLSITGSLTNTS